MTGWNEAELESRLTAMRVVLHQLAGNPSPTARAVIERFRDLPSAAQSARSGLGVLDEARTGLRCWVSERSGIHAPRRPAVLLPDVGVALPLATANVLEHSDRRSHRTPSPRRRACARAVLFAARAMDISRAQDVAIRWTGITFHLGGIAAQDSTPLLQGALRFPDAVPGPFRVPIQVQQGVGVDPPRRRNLAQDQPLRWRAPGTSRTRRR